MATITPVTTTAATTTATSTTQATTATTTVVTRTVISNGDHNGAGGGGNGRGDHANTGGQVTKVPVGSVDTGDGSTTAGTGVVPYLVAGALMLAGAAAGVTRRLRRDS